MIPENSFGADNQPETARSINLRALLVTYLVKLLQEDFGADFADSLRGPN